MAWYWHNNRHKSTEHNVSPEINPHLHGQLVINKGENIQCSKDGVFNSVEKTGQIHAKNKNIPLSYIIYKNKLKMDQKVKCKTQIHKMLRRKHSKICDISPSNIYIFWYSSLGKGNKRKNEQMGLHHTKNFLHSKGNHQ